MRVSSRSLQHFLIQSLSFTLFEHFLIAYKAFFGHVVSLIIIVGRVGVLGTVAMQVSCFSPTTLTFGVFCQVFFRPLNILQRYALHSILHFLF